MKSKISKSIVVIVAHPDDETLWAGGTILSHPSNKWFVVTLCRASDKDRSTRFHNTLKLLNAEGIMGDLDDGPDQKPLDEKELEDLILQLLPSTHFDLIITHSPMGEYTRHLRHEEVNKAVTALWKDGKIAAKELWTFAYEDGNKAYFPRAIENANIYEALPEQIWLKKYSIITETYGFKKDSWEAETTPKAEAFWQFKDPAELKDSTEEKTDNKEKELEIFKTTNLEVLKSMYYKSKAYINDKISWDTETTHIAESFWQFADSKKAKMSLEHVGNELRIFKTPSIEVLKSLYYHSVGNLFNKYSWELDINNLKETFWQYGSMQNAKESFRHFGKELKIFNRPSIEVLKLLYTKSLGHLFQKESWEFESPSISKTFRLLNKTHRTRRTLDKIGNELRIFNKPSIENLKSIYKKTSEYLEGTHEQEEQTSSI